GGGVGRWGGGGAGGGGVEGRGMAIRGPRGLRVLLGIIVASTTSLAFSAACAEAPAGQMTLAYNITIAPRWFDPAESEALVTPFIFYYALHDALVNPMPGNQ